LLSAVLLFWGCKADDNIDPGEQEPILENPVDKLDNIKSYPGLILKSDFIDQYKSRFDLLPGDSPSKKNKIVRAMFSGSESDKKNATAEFITYWKNYAQRWTKEALDKDQPDGVSMRGIWRCIHLYDIVKSFGYLSTADEVEFRTKLVQAIQWAIGTDSKNPRIPKDNWRMSNIYTDVFCAAGLVGLTFSDMPQSVDWVNHTISELKWQLDNCVWDGAWHETPRYHAYTMKLMGQFMEVLKNRTGIDLFQHKANKELAKWFIDFNTPLDNIAGAYAGVEDGVRLFPGIGDSAWGENIAPVNQFASHYIESDPVLSAELMWLWDQSGHKFSEEPVLDLLIDPILPKAKPSKRGSLISRRRGYIVMRDKFETEDEVWMFLKCGETSMHDHGDKNSFSLIAYGSPLMLDSGTGDYEDPSHKEWNKREISHNGIAFRNKGESDIFKYSIQKALSGKIIHWQTSDKVDYSVTDAAIPAAVSEYTKEVIFVKPDYFIIRDKVSATTNKEAVWMMHTPCNDIEWKDNSILCSNELGVSLEIHVVSPSAKLTKMQSKGRFGTWTDAKPNAIAGLYPFKYQNTLQVVAPSIGDIVTVLHPMKQGDNPITVNSSDEGQTLRITCRGRTDEIKFLYEKVEVNISGEKIILQYN